jgi:hypothetical protein
MCMLNSKSSLFLVHVKGTVCKCFVECVYAMKACRGSGGVAPLIFKLGTGWR